MSEESLYFYTHFNLTLKQCPSLNKSKAFPILRPRPLLKAKITLILLPGPPPTHWQVLMDTYSEAKNTPRLLRPISNPLVATKWTHRLLPDYPDYSLTTPWPSLLLLVGCRC